MSRFQEPLLLFLKYLSIALDDIKKKIREVEHESVIYVPVKGLFWLRKGKKNNV
jgi:hypothetical protein